MTEVNIGVNSESLLPPLRVLDLTDEKGFLCGKILGDCGADVIKVEKPGGDISRRIGPFYKDIADPEKSLFWFAYNTSKRGITLNIETADGREVFKRLAATADFIIESFPRGYMDKVGLGYATLSEMNPRLIMTSITPFGQTGPYKDYKSSDLVAWATGGMLHISGDPDRPPVRMNAEFAYCEAGAQAAMATLIANHYREQTGEGQYVDVSIQECILETLWNVQQYWSIGKIIFPRTGKYVKRGLVNSRRQYRCQDGSVAWQILTSVMGRRTRVLVEWMESEGMASDALKEVKWEEIDMYKMPQEQIFAWEEEFERFFLVHSKGELLDEGTKRGVMLFPCNNTRECLEDSHLAEREFWVEVEHPELDTSIVYPGAPFKLSKAAWKISRPAPLIGEHNEEIYVKELGFSKEELVLLKEANVI